MARTDEQLNFRIPVGLRDWLKAQAARSRRSMTAEVVVALEQYKARQEQRQPQGAVQ